MSKDNSLAFIGEKTSAMTLPVYDFVKAGLIAS
jgi:hypothetical protein